MILRAIRRVLFWTYARGSWQYDLICLVILTFIFLTPRSVFDRSVTEDPKSGESILPSRPDPLAGNREKVVRPSERTDVGEPAKPLPESVSDTGAQLDSTNQENQEQQP